jgi:retron-type reverse transcriptase
MAVENLYDKIISLKNLIAGWERAKKGKTRKQDVCEFGENIAYNLKILHDELKNQAYKPKPLQTFILRDPKTRTISKSDFRDRIVHHALVRIIEPTFEKVFIYDSCANRLKRGTLFAIKRLDRFKRQVTNGGKFDAYCLKTDIKHYFQEVDHEILLKIISKRIKDEKTLWLIKRILENNVSSNPFGKGMPLGNLTSQFFANVYLHELDHFVKQELKAKFYIRYVDDFILLHSSKRRLLVIKDKIEAFLTKNLKLELHKDKSKIILLSSGIDFVGFRNFYHYRLLRKRNIRTMKGRIEDFYQGKISEKKMEEIFNGWNAYSKWSDSFKLRKEIKKKYSTLKLLNFY